MLSRLAARDGSEETTAAAKMARKRAARTTAGRLQENKVSKTTVRHMLRITARQPRRIFDETQAGGAGRGARVALGPVGDAGAGARGLEGEQRRALARGARGRRARAGLCAGRQAGPSDYAAL
jgi:hypothetical protein